MNKSWNLEEIDFGILKREMVENDERLFYLLASASFVEILSEVYSGNLIEHYDGDHEAIAWLRETWQREEVQHGQSLKRYVQTVWPAFDWERSYSGFVAEYRALCSIENLESSRALEMVARCVVETGTSTLYRCLYDHVEEPLLKEILSNIKSDEVRHYSKFRKLFIEHNHLEKKGVMAVFRVIWKRMAEIRGEDGYIAFKHAYLCRSGNPGNLEEEWSKFRKSLNSLMLRHYPISLTYSRLRFW
ncbi:MAG TPA: ferritin-like domain-containing protein, partial [Burkholderiales bacterium]|nr:ferritin-like domain-containing protein [Burkholderiales bacterium]